jgi:hypothetical protein
MLSDLARGPGLAMLVVAALAAFVVTSFSVVTTDPGGERSVFLWIVDAATTVFVLLATAGIVSADFTAGYHRNLFARPVSPALYYLQRWLLGGVAVAVGVVIVGLAVSARLHTPMIDPALLAQTGLEYLLLGGLVFVLSTFTRRDWLVALFVVVFHGSLSAGQAIGLASGPVGRLFYAALPPFHLVGPRHPIPDGAGLLQVGCYGLALVLGALAMLRWRALASGARA